MTDINHQSDKSPAGGAYFQERQELVVPGRANISRTGMLVDLLVESFRQHDGGMVELALPKGITISELGSGLNARAKAEGMPYRVWYGDSSFWDDMESSEQILSVPERTYRFVIRPSSIGKHVDEQVSEYGPGAPLEVVALAESAIRLLSKNNGSIFRIDGDNHQVKVRGATPDYKLHSSFYYGVHSEFDNGAPSGTIAYAQQIL
ncbi:MAG: hypothetical protein ACO3XO_08970 [Bdellovibrionota bacterium]|jgi:hypothetical protein